MDKCEPVFNILNIWASAGVVYRKKWFISSSMLGWPLLIELKFWFIFTTTLGELLPNKMHGHTSLQPRNPTCSKLWCVFWHLSITVMCKTVGVLWDQNRHFSHVAVSLGLPWPYTIRLTGWPFLVHFWLLPNTCILESLFMHWFAHVKVAVRYKKYRNKLRAS